MNLDILRSNFFSEPGSHTSFLNLDVQIVKTPSGQYP